jgi:CTP synthase
MKYIFVTGGVVSSLGKGLTAASLGTLLENRGSRSRCRSSTLPQRGSRHDEPVQHGEVYVLDDGAETDLDLGHYERFTNVKLTRLNNLTSGQVYQTVLNNEREGKYLGKTVQVIPHVTDEIKNRIHVLAENPRPTSSSPKSAARPATSRACRFWRPSASSRWKSAGQRHFRPRHLRAVHQGGGRIEDQAHAAIGRQAARNRHRAAHLVCRCEKPLDKDCARRFPCSATCPSRRSSRRRTWTTFIYEVPLMLQRERADDLVCRLLHLDTPPANMTHWQEIIRKLIAPQHRVRIGVVGKYIGLQDAYKSVYEAISHGGIANDCGVEIVQGGFRGDRKGTARRKS